MATYRQVYTEFWQDGFVLELTPEEKYFYLYLMTNSKTTQCGIYELPKRIMEIETGYNRETVEKLIQRFVDYGKILYCNPTREVILLNWMKYNSINSPTVKTRIENELKNVKNREFIRVFEEKCTEFNYPIDTLSIDYRKKEKRIEEEREEILYVEIIEYLNSQTNSNYKHSTKRTRDLIKARWNEGFRLDDFKKVIDIKTKEWINDPKFSKFLRPETLFSNKFEGYLNQKEVGNYECNRPSGREPNPNELDQLSL